MTWTNDDGFDGEEEDDAIDNSQVTCPECNSADVEIVEGLWECMDCAEVWADD